MRDYYQLIKPGYLFSNLLTALAGFFLASKGHINIVLLVWTMIGIGFGITSASIFNNYIDRKIDAKMERTKSRVLVTGKISKQVAILLACLFGLLAVIILTQFTNITTLLVGAVGFLFYEVFYSISKRHTSWSTLIGSVPGSIVPVAGYTAVTGHIDMGAILLFVILTAWQMPHFYAIALYRLDDYKNAGIPVLPVSRGIVATKQGILVYTIIFALASLGLFVTGYTGRIYVVVMSILSLWWIFSASYGFWAKDVSKWARKMFFLSLLINLCFCLLIIGSNL